MSLNDSPLAKADLAEVLKTLLGKGDPPGLSAELTPLYDLPSEVREAIRARMPTFDRWGLLRAGEASRQENPNRQGAIAEREEDTAGSVGSGPGAARKAPKSKKRPASAGSGTASVDDERTESVDTPPLADSPQARPVHDAEVQSSSRVPKRARLGDVGSGPDASACAMGPALEFLRRERSPRTWARLGQ